MKKFLLIVLLLVLPLQYSWAAAAVYCQHERGAAPHLGHHAHQHQAQDGQAQDDDGGGGASKAFHADCESCHLFSHAALVPDMPAPLASMAQSHRATPARHYASHIPDSPKRPDWPLVA